MNKLLHFQLCILGSPYNNMHRMPFNISYNLHGANWMKITNLKFTEHISIGVQCLFEFGSPWFCGFFEFSFLSKPWSNWNQGYETTFSFCICSEFAIIFLVFTHTHMTIYGCLRQLCDQFLMRVMLFHCDVTLVT